MVSYNVKSLFTSIPVYLAPAIAKERLQQDQELTERTNMSATNVLKLQDLKLQFWSFRNLEASGFQIWWPPLQADFCVHNGFTNQSCVGRPHNGSKIGETAITTALHPPKWWFRYIDDSHACLKNDQVDAFHQHLNLLTFPRHHHVQTRHGSSSGGLQKANPYRPLPWFSLSPPLVPQKISG